MNGLAVNEILFYFIVHMYISIIKNILERSIKIKSMRITHIIYTRLKNFALSIINFVTKTILFCEKSKLIEEAVKEQQIILRHCVYVCFLSRA